MSRPCRVPGNERQLGSVDLGAIVAAGEPMPIAVEGHRDRGVPQALLDDLGRQFPVDAPGGVEVPQHVQAGVFGLALDGDQASSDAGRDQAGLHEVAMLDEPAGAGWEHQFPMRAAQLPLLKSVRHDLAKGDDAMAGCRFGRPNVDKTVGSLPDVQDAVLEADIPYAVGIFIL